MLSSDTGWSILSRKGKKNLRWSSHLFSLEQIDLHSFSSNDNLSSLTLNTRKKTVGRQSQYQMTGQANHRKKKSSPWSKISRVGGSAALVLLCSSRCRLCAAQPAASSLHTAWVLPPTTCLAHYGFRNGDKILLVWQELNRGSEH